MADPANYDSVWLECNWNGTDGDTSFTPTITPTSYGSPILPSFNGGAHIEDTVPLFSNAVLECDGVDDVVYFGNAGTSSFLSDHTISYAVEKWVYFDSLSGDQIIMSNTYAPSSGDDSGFNLGSDASGNMIGGISDTSGMLESFAASSVFTAATWHYIKISFDVSTGFKVRVDGTVVASGSIGSTPGLQYILGIAWGRYRYSNEGHLNGRIGPTRITKGDTLDDDDVPTDIFAEPEAPDYFARVSIPGPLNPGGFYSSAVVDYSNISGVQATRFIMELTGASRLRIPISVWQATIATDVATYAQCTIPAVTDYAEEIKTRLNDGERFILFRLFELDDVTAQSVGQETAQMVVLDAPMEIANFTDRVDGYSCLLAGYDAIRIAPVTPVTYLLSGIHSINQSATGILRVRCAINWSIQPGDIADTGIESFTVVYITYYTNATESYMVVGQR